MTCTFAKGCEIVRKTVLSSCIDHISICTCEAVLQLVVNEFNQDCQAHLAMTLSPYTSLTLSK